MTSEERREARYQRRRRKRVEKRMARMEGPGSFENAFSLGRIYASFGECRKGVAWKRAVKVYNINRLKYSFRAFRDLHALSYRFRGFEEFTIYERGKRREIRSIHINDRVVQKCLCDSLVPALAPSLIYDNGACLKGGGTAKALKRFRCMLDRHYRKHGNEGYALSIDASSYFGSILHAPVMKALAGAFTDKRMLGLAVMFLRREGGTGEPGRGLSLGCQPNQVYAVWYLNAVDHYAKEALGLKGYVRFMDDTVIIHESKEYLAHCLEKIREKYRELGITLNPRKTQVVKLKKGVKFLKTMHYLTDTGRVVRKPWKKSVSRMRRKLKKFRKLLDAGEMSFADIRASYGSWRGHVRHFDSYRTVQNMDRLFNRLFVGDFIREGGMEGVQDKRRHRQGA